MPDHFTSRITCLPSHINAMVRPSFGIALPLRSVQTQAMAATRESVISFFALRKNIYFSPLESATLGGKADK